jgi:glutaredoxin
MEPAASARVEPQVQPRRAQPPPISIRDDDVDVYTTPWCSVCKRAKAWMNENGIAYDERDIESSSEYMRQIRAINPRASIPTFDVEGTVLVGFSEDGLVRAMQQVARLRAERRNY